jgi:hypothetical protein
VVGGERISPTRLGGLSAQVTPGSGDYDYGAGFWTNRATGPAIKARVRAGMPRDSLRAFI